MKLKLKFNARYNKVGCLEITSIIYKGELPQNYIIAKPKNDYRKRIMNMNNKYKCSICHENDDYKGYNFIFFNFFNYDDYDWRICGQCRMKFDVEDMLEHFTSLRNGSLLRKTHDCLFCSNPYSPDNCTKCCGDGLDDECNCWVDMEICQYVNSNSRSGSMKACFDVNYEVIDKYENTFLCGECDEFVKNYDISNIYFRIRNR